VDFGFVFHSVSQALAHFLLQIAKDAADLLERETLFAERGDDGDFHYFIRCIDASMAILPGRDYVALIPPLKLAETDTRNPSDVAAREDLFIRNFHRFRSS
jgi:hypothetical protein